MKIVLNTRTDDAASRAAIVGLAARLQAAGADATLGDFSGYGSYDAAVFLGYDHELERARQENPRIRVALADPKQSRPQWLAAARAADLLLVSSVEQREAFLPLNRNILVFQMWGRMPSARRMPRDDGTFVVGYHGNRIHLEAMAETVTPALEELGRRRPVEFVAIYNRRDLGRAELGLPDPKVVAVREVEWEDELAPGTDVSRSLVEELPGVDVGIVPSLLPVAGGVRALLTTARRDTRLAYEPFDHLVRFKASTNAGRIYPFARLGIPVVADFTPSNAQFIRDGQSGFLASSAHGWFEALSRLADDPSLRMRLGQRLRDVVQEHYDAQTGLVLDALRAPPLGPPVRIGSAPSPEERLALFVRFPSPSRPALRDRLRTRLAWVSRFPR